MPNKDKMSFIYLSGMGTKTNGRQYWQMVKSSTEQTIISMGFKHSYGWRPAMMTPYRGQKSKQVLAQKVMLVFYPIMRIIGLVCSMPEMLNAMYRVCTDGYDKSFVEPKEIIALAK